MFFIEPTSLKLFAEGSVQGTTSSFQPVRSVLVDVPFWRRSDLFFWGNQEGGAESISHEAMVE